MSDTHQREHHEPTEKDRAIPMAMWVVVGVLTLWGVGFYVMSADQASAPAIATAQAGGTPSAQKPEAETTPTAPAKTEKTAPSTAETSAPANDIDGAALYAANCQACHQADGVGMAGVFPPLKDASWVTGDPQVLSGIILAGYMGSLEVLGKTYNGVMPGFADKFNDAEAAALINYLRTSINSADAIDEQLIAEVRSQLPGSPFTSQESLSEFAKP